MCMTNRRSPRAGSRHAPWVPAPGIGPYCGTRHPYLWVLRRT
ncbi:hypothetical protein RHOER0001_3354 [Rhodococcus erythropolis SK121]|nr:hypothetical protein RHOER0001_3354 [Rhodococcus erythropolis SK121]